MKVKPKKGELLATIAPLLEYPQSDYFENLDTVYKTSRGLGKKVEESLLDFKKLMHEYDIHEIEELYTRTFDVAPVCSPYVSVHIYGDENFDRGNFMATLATKFEERNFQSPTNELPDHITVLLRFSKYLTEEELSELTEFCLNEPLERMSDSLKGKAKSNPYYFPMIAVKEILMSKHLK